MVKRAKLTHVAFNSVEPIIIAWALARYHVQVVVAGVVVAKALFWTDIVTVFGLLATDLGPGCYDHFNYDHLDVVPIGRARPRTSMLVM